MSDGKMAWEIDVFSVCAFFTWGGGRTGGKQKDGTFLRTKAVKGV